jgi:signal transduction histidine kinase
MSSYRNPRSISVKLTQMNFMVSATALLLACLSFFAYDLYSFRQSLVGSLATEAHIIGGNSVSAIMFSDRQAAETTLSALKNSPHVLSCAVFDNSGRLFATYTREGYPPKSIRPALKPGETTSRWTEGGNIILGNRIDFQGQTVGTVYILADTTEVLAHARSYALIVILILFLCLLCALLVAANFRRMLADPLIDLAETAKTVSDRKDYSIRAMEAGEVYEISTVVTSFNEMLSQIEEQNQALRHAKDELEKREEERTIELSAANNELEAFSYSVAHDLRGPLDMIGNIGFLLDCSPVISGDEPTKGLVDELLRGTKKMADLIADLLNLSRATRVNLDVKEIDLTDMASSIVKGLQSSDPDRTAKITVTPEARVIADESLLCIVLDNLLRNAWKYTSKVSLAEIEFGSFQQDSRTIYFVSDNGAGFDPSLSDRLFQPFQRLHTDSEFPGTGIGLATVQRVITRHGGRVWAQGEVDRGATVYFTLPDQPALESATTQSLPG